MKVARSPVRLIRAEGVSGIYDDREARRFYNSVLCYLIEPPSMRFAHPGTVGIVLPMGNYCTLGGVS